MITLREAMCPVCREITIQPVTMPCQHIICLQCFESTVEKSNLSCPLCRKRLGSWMRTETNKGKTLVNINLWERIKSSFPDLVNAKLNGIDTSGEIFCTPPKKRQISSPGAIRREYECSLEEARVQEERDRKKREEEEEISINYIRQLQEEEALEEEPVHDNDEEARASERLIQSIQEEEERNHKEEVERRLLDEKLAKDLQDTLTDNVTPAKSMELSESARDIRDAGSSSGTNPKRHKTFTSRKKGPMDQFLSANRSLSNLSDCSHDSIVLETLHFFKPLKPFPITPPKLHPDRKIQKIPCIRLTPKDLSFDLDVAANPAGANRLSYRSPGLSQQLSLINLQRGTNTTLSSPHRSAFSGCVKSDPEPRTEPPSRLSPTMEAEQLRAEQLIAQEHSDFLMAQRLQDELNAAERNTYQLRHPRQATLHETLAGRRKRESPKKRDRPGASPGKSPSLRVVLEANVKRFKQQEEQNRCHQDVQ